MKQFFCALALLLSLLVVLPDSFAQTSSRTSTSQKKSKRSSSDSTPWENVTLLLDRPEKPYEVIGLVSAPQIFLWDDEDSMKESLQNRLENESRRCHSRPGRYQFPIHRSRWWRKWSRHPLQIIVAFPACPSGH